MYQFTGADEYFECYLYLQDKQMCDFGLEYGHLLEVFTFIYLMVFYYEIHGSCLSSKLIYIRV